MQGSVAGYGESSVYGQSGYGEYGQQNVGSANPKRSNPYAQVSADLELLSLAYGLNRLGCSS